MTGSKINSMLILIVIMLIISAMSINAAEESDGGADARSRIAVYVTGGRSDSDNKALATYILSELIRVRGDKYVAIERSEAFLEQIKNEHVKQRSGAIDDSQISRLGKQSGVQLICVVDITPVMDAFLVSARILDVETAKVSAVGVSNSKLRNAADMRNAANEVVGAMFGIAEKSGIKIRLGARIAYNNSYLRSASVSERYADDETGIVVNRYENEIGPGGIAGGVVVDFGITNKLSIITGFEAVYRVPVNMEILTVSEAALSIPLLVRWRLTENLPVFIDAGIQADVPLSTKLTIEGNDPVTLQERKPFDIGIVLGAGYFIGKNLSIDIRGIIGVTPFDEDNKKHLMNQLNLGLNYIF